MAHKIEIEELIDLLRNGFDPKLISLELEIPMEDIIKCQKMMEERMFLTQKQIVNKEEETIKFKTPIQKTPEIKQEKNNKKEYTKKSINVAHRKVQQMRSIYESLTTPKEIKPENPSTLDKVDEISDPYEILETIEQQFGRKTNLTEKEKYQKRELEKLLVDAIIYTVDNTDNLEKLQNLSKMIPYQKAIKYPLQIGMAKSKLNYKIMKIQQNKFLDNRINSISKQLIEIVESISNNSFDYENAIKIIEQEANKRRQNKTKTKFSLTQEQETKQILFQIVAVLGEQSEKYPLSNPQIAINNLLKLSNGDKNMAINTVIKNLSSRKEFNTAKQICEGYMRACNKSDTPNSFYLWVRNLRKNVVRAELAESILTNLSTDNLPETDFHFLVSLKNELDVEKIQMSSVELGKSSDNSHTITLEEICNGTIPQLER